jgi:uncharacterized protein
MTTTYTTPGVYIEEMPAIGPIVGVGTSTTAFIGAALQGPSFDPTVITNWTQFVGTFGSYMVNPPGFYLAYAVKGYFDNGGQAAVILRVGTSQTASLTLVDRGGAQDALVVSALIDGVAGNTITVASANSQIVPLTNNCVVTRASATITSASGNIVVLQNITDASNFSPGDAVVIEGTGDGAIITRIVGSNLILQTNLSGTYTSGSVRIADLAIGQTTFRLTNGAGLEPGSIIELNDGSANEYQVISQVNGPFVVLQGAGLTNKYNMETLAAPTTVESFEFSLTVTDPPNVPELWQNLSMDPRHSRYWGSVVQSLYVSLALPPTPDTDTPPNNLPAALATKALAGGTADNPLGLGLAQYERAIAAMVPLQDVELVVVPDRTDQAVQQAVIAHCETMMDRFAILHTQQGLAPDASPSSPLMLQRAWCTSQGGYAALYYPWITINDPNSLTGNDTITVPPSGHIAGIYNRTDAVGVQVAPANQPIIDAVGLEANVDGVTQGLLNVAGINVSRIFPGQALPLVWGARTTTPANQTAMLYINVRRLFIFVETSLKYGLMPYVFNTNNTSLWKRLNRAITDFLTRVWQAGALFGSTAAQAFYIQIDDENNPPDLQALGQVNITIGMAPVYPAEFIIVQIGIWEGGATVTEQT